jgi:hypothetical protein
MRNSRRRADSRASSRLQTFAHSTRKTNPTAPASIGTARWEYESIAIPARGRGVARVCAVEGSAEWAASVAVRRASGMGTPGATRT